MKTYQRCQVLVNAGSGEPVLFPIRENLQQSMRELELAWACSQNYLLLAQWIWNCMHLRNPDFYFCDVLASACEGGLKIAQWYCHVTAKVARYNEILALKSACLKGHLDVAQWLVSTCDIRRKHVVADLSSFEKACESGRMEIVQWMAETFNLTAESVRGAVLRSSAFSSACAGGNFEIVRWFAATFQLSRSNGVRNIESFRYVCLHGIEAAQWMVDLLQITAADDLSALVNAVHEVCERGIVDVARWLVASFHLTNEEVNEHDLLFAACTSGNLSTAQWVCDEFQIKPIPGERFAAFACRFFLESLQVLQC